MPVGEIRARIRVGTPTRLSACPTCGSKCLLSSGNGNKRLANIIKWSGFFKEKAELVFFLFLTVKFQLFISYKSTLYIKAAGRSGSAGGLAFCSPGKMGQL